MTNYQDFCKSVTKQLFAILDQQGSLLTWQACWDSKGCQQLPRGIKGLYRGANLTVLLMAQWEKGFNSHQWLTFHQINQQGGKVKKGAKSQVVYFWKIQDESNEKEKKIKKKVLLKTYFVFNREQTTLSTDSMPPTYQPGLIDTLIEKCGVVISHFGNQPHYESVNDVIVLPTVDRFTSKENYTVALLHELVHWTARENRVPRACFDHYHTDKTARAEEELIAEIGSVLLATHYGIKGELENHAAYVQSWKTLLNETQVMRAAQKASKAFEWLIKQGEEG